MKYIARIVIAALVLIGILTFVACLMPATVLLWTSFGWSVLAIILFSIAIGSFALGSKDGYLLKIPFPMIMWMYPVAVFFSSLIFILLEYIKIFSLPIAFLCLIEIVISAVFVWSFLALSSGRQLIQDTGKAVEDKYKNWKYMAANADGIVALADAADRDVVIKVVEAFRYSDPVTPEPLRNLDAEISTALAVLKTAVESHDSAQVKAAADRLCELIRNRSEQIKIFK